MFEGKVFSSFDPATHVIPGGPTVGLGLLREYGILRDDESHLGRHLGRHADGRQNPHSRAL